MKKIFIFANCFLIFILVFIVRCFSWFFYESVINPNIHGGTAESYFHRGDGTYDYPFTITKPVHLYNLSKLQEVGAFGKNHYYFQLGIEMLNGEIVETPVYSLDNNGKVIPGEDYDYFVYSNADLSVGGNPSSKVLDMTDFSKNGENFVVPIGGSLIKKDVDGSDLLAENYYPSQFLGQFEGNELAIRNLHVQADSSFCHVGMFGAVGTESLVQNFILDNPRIETISATPASISFPDLPTNNAEYHNYIGFIAGYTNGGIHNIGVYKGDLVLSSAAYNSKFSWVGYGTKGINNGADVSGKILDYIIQWGYLVQLMGVQGTSWNDWQGTNGNTISQNYNAAVTNVFTNDNPDDDPYNKNVFELVSPIVMEKINSAGFTASGVYYFPAREYDVMGNPLNTVINATAPPDYTETITTNHVYPNGTSLDTVFKANGSVSTLSNGQGGIRFTVDNAGELLLTYSAAKSSTLAVYKKNDSGTNYLRYDDADWTFGSGKVATPTLSNVRLVTQSATATAYPYSPAASNGSVVTCVVRVKTAGTYIIGVSSGDPVAFGYTRFIIDSKYGNTGGNTVGSKDTISSIDFTYYLNDELLFPIYETFAYSRINIFFPFATSGITLPINLFYRRDVKTITPLAIVFDMYSPTFNSQYYISKKGSGLLNMLASPPS